MKITFPTAIAATVAGALWLQTSRAAAQDATPPPASPTPAASASPSPGGPGAPGGRGGNGQTREEREAQFRQRMNERVKTALKATDEEWSVIQPLLDNVQTKTREAMVGRFGGPGGMFGGGRGPRPDNNGGGANPAGDRPNRPQPRGSAEAQALNQTLEADAPTADIKVKLEALRAQRKQAEADLAQSRDDLKKVLNLRQEATLVLMGVLD